MWKYVKFVLGILLMLVSLNGLFTLSKGDLQEVGRKIAENGVNTDGVIKDVYVTTWGARKGWVGAFGRYYTMSYRFTTLEGETFSSEIEITKAQANSARKGQKIRVRYYSQQPSINSALGFKSYMSAKDAKDVPIGMIIFSILLFFLGGAWLTWSNWRRIRPAQAPLSAAARMAATRTQSPASAPSAAGRSGGFGQR